MKILILGGTIFLGRHLAASALARGHTLTLFNRGQHNPELFPMVEKLRGDRDGDLAALAGRSWDSVIDTCGYLPRLVRASSEFLAPAVGHYTFISSLSVFPDDAPPGADEHTLVSVLSEPTVETITGETYGPLKALCEQAVAAVLPGGALNIRPGLIVGPHDNSDRFTYWPHRLARGGKVLAPGRPERPIQFIDGRDLAEWILRLVELRQTGVYNATGPACVLSMGEFLETCREAGRSPAEFVWVSDDFLLEHQVAPYSELPLWVPEAAYPAFDTFDCRKAISAGLAFRPIAETIWDTLEWDRTRPIDTSWRAGLAPEREAALLAAWN